MNDYIFDIEYITNIKKNIINYVSRTNINVNKIAFNLSLYKDFVIVDDLSTTIKVILPKIVNRKVVEAKVEIGSGFFYTTSKGTYIKPEYEDIFANKITRILVQAAAIKFKYENMIPVDIEYVGLINDGDGFDYAVSLIIAEEVNNYVTPHFEEAYHFNIGLVRMILAIVGYKNIINTYFNHDKSLFVALYSLSVDSNIFLKINKELTLVKRLIATKNHISDEKEIDLLDRLIKAKEFELLNFIINKLYIPFINSVPLDKRKQVRDEILKGFLGRGYTNLKLTDENKESYYFASLVNNTVPINNKITDQSWAYFREQVRLQNKANYKDIYSMYSKNKSRNNIKYFWVLGIGNSVYIKTEKKEIKEKKLVLEMLSYAYINSIDSNLLKQIENGIVKLCSLNDTFTSTLNNNPLSNMMLTAAIIQLAKKNGFNIELVGIENNVAKFNVIEKEPV